MSPRPLICAAAVGAALICQQPSRAEPNDAPAVPGADAAASKPTALSGFDVVVRRKAEPTGVSGVDVVVKRATRLSEVEVALPPCPQANKSPEPGFKPPKVVSAFPEKGRVVRPGLLVLRVTFDKPMTCIGLLAPAPAPLPDFNNKEQPKFNPCPAPLRSPMISRDRRTFLTVCVLGKDTRYGLRLKQFTSLGGRALDHYDLEFKTSEKGQIATIEEAVAQDPWLQQVTRPGSSAVNR